MLRSSQWICREMDCRRPWHDRLKSPPMARSYERQGLSSDNINMGIDYCKFSLLAGTKCCISFPAQQGKYALRYVFDGRDWITCGLLTNNRLSPRRTLTIAHDCFNLAVLYFCVCLIQGIYLSIQARHRKRWVCRFELVYIAWQSGVCLCECVYATDYCNFVVGGAYNNKYYPRGERKRYSWLH